MWLTALSLRRPLLIIMAVLAIMMAGVVSHGSLPVDLLLSVKSPYVAIVIPYPGAGPREVDSRVAKPVENAAAGATGIKNLFSTSGDGYGLLVLEFVDGTDPDAAIQDVERRLNRVRSSLPEDILTPIISKSDPKDQPILILGATWDRNPEGMFQLVDDSLRPRLEAVAGVASVGAIGALAVTRDTLNMMSMVGLIMLTGLVAKNAIPLVDYTNTLRERGYSRQEALLEAGPTRLRPIIMTTASQVFAMLPLAMKIGEGATTCALLAIVVIGGLLTSTLGTLAVVPAAHTVANDFQLRLGALFGRTQATGSGLSETDAHDDGHTEKAPPPHTGPRESA